MIRFKLWALVVASCLGLASSAGAGDLRIIIKSISAEETKANGDAWDIGGNAPDLFVKVDNGRRTVSSRARQDTYLANINFDTGLTAEIGDQIEITVYDEDIASDDIVGRATVLVDEEGAKIASFGQVKALVIVFR